MINYEIEVTEENVGVVRSCGREVFRSRACRLAVQARRLAQDWVDEQIGKQPGDITLQVEHVSVDPDQLFGGRHG